METLFSIPDKLYFKIGEVAEQVGVKPYVLRYWEKEFPEIAPSKTQGQQRLYSRETLELILRIRDLLYEKKFTLSGARQQLRLPQLSPQMGLPLNSAEFRGLALQALREKLLALRALLKGE